MYEEDRMTALSMYERMFDDTADEEGLLQLLVSPTRQAVVLARSYDAKERKLQVQSQSRDTDYAADPEDVPSFVFVIDKVAQQAEELGVKFPAVTEGQFSIFDVAEELPAEEEAPVQQEEPLPEAEIPVGEAEDESSGAEDAPAAEAEEALPENEEIETEEAAPAEETAEAAPEAAEESSNVDETANAVDAFLAAFSIENGELVPDRTEEEEEAAAAEDALPVAEGAEPDDKTPVEYRQKTNIFLLILYIFLAIPLGLVGIAALLLPTVLCLALAVCCGFAGVSVIGSCFGSFAVIADTMVVFGAGLICLALAILFVWLFIWFLAGVIVGFIRGLCRLGRKICCKEVAVQ